MPAFAESGNACAFRRIARWYFRAAVVYLSLGAVVGALMMRFGNDNFKFFHSHMLLVGTLLFAVYGIGNMWIANRADKMLPPGPSTFLAVVQFWLANIGLPGMLLWYVLPVGLVPDRIGVLFGFIEAAAAVMYGLMLWRGLKNMEPEN
ncbi:MAG: hypothetical protein FWF95_07455 [Syntrophorhabdaceae bacterium]|nr:hypothetical protein [Syntrophorhabdaceae bacterium]